MGHGTRPPARAGHDAQPGRAPPVHPCGRCAGPDRPVLPGGADLPAASRPTSCRAVDGGRGPLAGRRHAGPLPRHGHHTGGARPTRRGAAGAPRRRRRLPPAHHPCRVPVHQRQQGAQRAEDPKVEADLPAPQVVLDALAGHLASHAPGADGTVFTTTAGTPLGHMYYGHLMPDSEDRTRRAIDSAWDAGALSCAPDVPHEAGSTS